MRVKATFQHVIQVTREVEIDDEEFARLHKHQANRDRDTSDEYLIPLHLNTRDDDYLADVFPDWKTSAPLPSDFVLQYTDVTEAERLPESNDPWPDTPDTAAAHYAACNPEPNDPS